MTSLRRIAKELERFTFESESSAKWIAVPELRRALSLLTAAIKELPQGRLRRLLQATATSITTILESRNGGVGKNGEVPDWLESYSSTILQKELRKCGSALAEYAREERRVTRRSFLKLFGLGAANLFLGRTILYLAGGEEAGEHSKREEGYYLQVGAFSTPAAAQAQAEHLAKAYPALGPLVVIDFEESVGPYKIFLQQRFETFDDVQNIAQLLRNVYSRLDFGIVRVFPNGKRRWLSTFAAKTAEALQVIEKEFKEQHLVGLTAQQRRYYPLIVEACRRYPISREELLNPLLVLAVMKVESDYVPTATSEVGAKGLLQLMPGMWNHFHKRSTLYHGRHPQEHTCSPYDPAQNIDAGVHMLSYLHQKYKRGTPHRLKLIIMAYHAGETNVNRGRIGPRTRQYQRRVLSTFSQMAKRVMNNPA